MPAAPRVVVDPGSHALLNLGDIAMLQVAVGRMRDAWPDATIEVLTTDPARLTRHCPAARPLPAAGRYAWIPEGRPPGLVRRTKLRRDPDARTYRRALRAADLFLVSGRGCVCDAFTDESHQLLGELETATSMGLPTAMMGQGMGPLSDPEVSARAAEVLPAVDLIAVREARTAPPLLDALGVDSDRVVVTGDDALEPAARAPTGALAGSIGLNLREVDYAGVDERVTEEVGAAVRAVASRLGAALNSVPISLHPSESDPETFARVAGESPPAPATTREAIAAIGTCRVVVTGSYHAAVFALAQGIPAVGIAASPYYRSKFEGLADQYGGALPVLEPGRPDFAARLADEVEAAWGSGSRAELVEATERQLRAGRAAYERLAGLVGVSARERAPA